VLIGVLCVSVCIISDCSRKSDTTLSNHDPRTAVQLRTALKRLKEIMEGKSQVRTHTPSPSRFRRYAYFISIFWKPRHDRGTRRGLSTPWLSPPCRTATWSSTGCQTASAKSATTATRSSPPSAAATTAACAARSSAAAAATRRSPGSSWATRVGHTIATFFKERATEYSRVT